LVDENGIVIREIRKGAVNPNDIGMEKAISLLKSGISEVCRDIPYSDVTMFAGIAGGGLSGDNAKILNRFFSEFGFFAFDNGSDIENLVSLRDEDPRVLVIMGTGFIVYALNGTERKRIAGWGQFFDEGGSGYTLGKDAITAVLCAGDGSGQPTLLTKLLEEKIGESAEAHLVQFYQGGKRYIAEFAELVFRASENGDKVANAILENNLSFAAHRIDTAVNALTKHPQNKMPIPVFFSGGISRKSDIIFPIIEKYLRNCSCQLIRLDDEPVEGALRRASKIFEETIKKK
jgi:N-acetylglucosamine kinase-like BadF-type ATPase